MRFRINKRMLVSLVILLTILSITSLLFWKAKARQEEKPMKLEKEILSVEIDEKVLAELANSEEVYLKVDSFIRERLPVTDIFLEFSLDNEHEELTLEVVRKQFFDTLYTAVVNENMDLFISIISAESIREIWNDEIEIEKRIANMKRVISNINRDGQLKTMHYQFEKEEEEKVATKGMLYFGYSDGIEVSIPFELSLTEIEEYHDGHHNEKFFSLESSILEIEQVILKHK